MPLKTTTSSALAEISLEMIVIPILPKTIIVDNEINEIIHDFEDDNKGNKFIFLHLSKSEYKMMKLNILYFYIINIKITISDFQFYRKFFLLNISGCLANYFER